MQNHVTFGATWKNGKSGELRLSYGHAIGKTVKGSGSVPAAPGGGETDLHLSEAVFGVAYGWRL